MLQTFQSRVGSPRLARPLSLPGGKQRVFALRPAANFPEREAHALPVHCPCPQHREGLHSAPLQTFHSGKPAPCPYTVHTWSTERVCTRPRCKLSRAGSPRLAGPLFLPRAQRGFGPRPTVNFTEQEARVLPGLSKLTDCFCGDNRRIARCDWRAHTHPQHGALSSSGCACECSRSRSTIPGPAAQSPGSSAIQAAVNALTHLLPASARPLTNTHIQTPSPLSFIKIKDRK